MCDPSNDGYLFEDAEYKFNLFFSIKILQPPSLHKYGSKYTKIKFQEPESVDLGNGAKKLKIFSSDGIVLNFWHSEMKNFPNFERNFLIIFIDFSILIQNFQLKCNFVIIQGGKLPPYLFLFV